MDTMKFFSEQCIPLYSFNGTIWALFTTEGCAGFASVH